MARYDGPYDDDLELNERDEAVDIAADASGNIYVTGSSFSLAPRTFEDVVTVKYEATGTRQWVRRFDAIGYGNDIAAGVDVDSAGNVFVAATSYWGEQTKDDYAVVKYDAAGSQKWASHYYGPIERPAYETAADIEIAPDGDPLVTGYSDNFSGSYLYDYATVKYEAGSGEEAAVARYNGPINGFDAPYDITIDDNGSVYVTGESAGGATSWDIATVKYSVP